MTIFMKSSDVIVMLAQISNQYSVTISGGECGLLDYKKFVCNYRKFFFNFKNKEDILKLGLVFEYNDSIFVCEFFDNSSNNLMLNYFCIPKEYFERDFLKVFKNINIEKLVDKIKVIKVNYSVGYLENLKTIHLKSWAINMGNTTMELKLNLAKQKYSKSFFDIVKLKIDSFNLILNGYIGEHSSLDLLLLECDKMKEVVYSCIIK